jgi:hypothetical protein
VRTLYRYGVSFTLIAIGLAVQVAAVATSCHTPQCPVCAPAPPPVLITHRERCMDPPPQLPVVVLPAPDVSGNVSLDRKSLAGLLQVLSLLSNYLETQYERCALPGVADAGPPAP